MSSGSEGRAPADGATAATQYISEVKEYVNRLQDLLEDEIRSKPSAARIMDEMREKISRGLSELEWYKATSDPGPTGTRGGSVCSDDRKSEVCSGKRKAVPVPTSDGRSGASRRRSQVSPGQTITRNSLDDGHTWRKYGQKTIQGSSQSRSYFRCTHKLDQGCQATRQVQRSEDNPAEYKISYIGAHTCRDPSTFHQIISMPDHNDVTNGNSFLINFGSRSYSGPSDVITRVMQKHVQMPMAMPSISPLQSPATQDCSEEVLSNLTPGSSPADCFMLCDELAPLVGSSTFTPLYAGSMHDQTDMISSLHSSPRSLDVGFASNPIAQLDQDCMQFGFDHEDDDFPLT